MDLEKADSTDAFQTECELSNAEGDLFGDYGWAFLQSEKNFHAVDMILLVFGLIICGGRCV
jgi:hypothetical protein